MEAIPDSKVAEVLIERAGADVDLQFVAMKLLKNPNDVHSLQRAKEVLRGVGDFRFEEDQDFERQQDEADQKETELERMAWNKMSTQVAKIGADKAANQRGTKITDIRMGDWSQRFATRHHGPRPRVPVPRSSDLRDICPRCGGDNMVPDYQRSELTCMHCFTVDVMTTPDIGASVHMQIKKRHIYSSVTHFMTYVRSVIGDTKYDKVPHLADILEELRFCFTDQEAREVLKQRGLNRMYSKVPTLMAWARDEYAVPRFTEAEINLFKMRHQFWLGVFRSMGDEAPRTYFFNTKYMLLRIMFEQNMYEKHKRFIDRYTFGVESTIISNELNWRVMFNYAKTRGFIPEESSYQCLPCYKQLVVTRLREEKRKKSKKARYT